MAQASACRVETLLYPLRSRTRRRITEANLGAADTSGSPPFGQSLAELTIGGEAAVAGTKNDGLPHGKVLVPQRLEAKTRLCG